MSTMAAAALTLLIILLAGPVAPVPLSRLPIRSIALLVIIRTGAENNLTLLQGRIASFGAVPSELTPIALERVRKLIELRDMIRDSPTSPKRRQALGHAVGSLIIPTITFFAAVFAQEYAGRVLDSLIP